MYYRLTPKPCRCGCSQSPAPYPWATDTAEQAFRSWEQLHHEKTKTYPVSKIIQTVGPESTHPEILEIIRIHDAYTCLDSPKPLA